MTTRSHRPTIVHDGTGWHVTCSCGTRTENLATHEEAQAAWRSHLPAPSDTDVAEALIAATPAPSAHRNDKEAVPSCEQGTGLPTKETHLHGPHRP